MSSAGCACLSLHTFHGPNLWTLAAPANGWCAAWISLHALAGLGNDSGIRMMADLPLQNGCAGLVHVIRRPTSPVGVVAVSTVWVFVLRNVSITV